MATPTSAKHFCAHCGAKYSLVTSYLLRDEAASAVAKTALHHHDAPDAWMDVVFGSWHDEAEDHQTFGCRVGPLSGSPDPAATAVDAAVHYSDSAFWGRKLSRAQALAHPQTEDFWAVVDFLLMNEPATSHHVYHR
jgi:hypothetical protein